MIRVDYIYIRALNLGGLHEFYMFYAQSSVEFEKQNVGSLLQSSILRYMNS